MQPNILLIGYNNKVLEMMQNKFILTQIKWLKQCVDDRKRFEVSDFSKNCFILIYLIGVLMFEEYAGVIWYLYNTNKTRLNFI